jgi:hypothetical protein
MSDIIYNKNAKQNGNSTSYSRKRNKSFLDGFVAKKHIQRTSRVCASHYMLLKAVHIGGQITKINKQNQHISYDGYLMKLKSEFTKSKGEMTGIVKGCKCGSEPELTYDAKTIDITYIEPDLNVETVVYAMKNPNTYYEKAQIISGDNVSGYKIKYKADLKNTTYTKTRQELENYFECKCGTIKKGNIYISDPTNIADCGLKVNNYFIQMGGYYKQLKCI